MSRKAAAIMASSRSGFQDGADAAALIEASWRASSPSRTYGGPAGPRWRHRSSTPEALPLKSTRCGRSGPESHQVGGDQQHRAARRPDIQGCWWMYSLAPMSTPGGLAGDDDGPGIWRAPGDDDSQCPGGGLPALLLVRGLMPALDGIPAPLGGLPPADEAPVPDGRRRGYPPPFSIMFAPGPGPPASGLGDVDQAGPSAAGLRPGHVPAEGLAAGLDGAHADKGLGELAAVSLPRRRSPDLAPTDWKERRSTAAARLSPPQEAPESLRAVSAAWRGAFSAPTSRPIIIRGHLGGGDVGGAHRPHGPAGAQGGDAVGNLRHLPEPVGDEDDGVPVLLSLRMVRNNSSGSPGGVRVAVGSSSTMILAPR